MSLSQLNPVEPPWYVTRMPGGVGGVAPRGVPLSRSSAHLAHSRAPRRRSFNCTDSGRSAWPEERVFMHHFSHFSLRSRLPRRAESCLGCPHLVSQMPPVKGHLAERELPKTCRAVDRISSDRVGSSTARASVIAPTTPARVVMARRRRAAAVPLHRPASRSNAVRT